MGYFDVLRGMARGKREEKAQVAEMVKTTLEPIAPTPIPKLSETTTERVWPSCHVCGRKCSREASPAINGRGNAVFWCENCGTRNEVGRDGRHVEENTSAMEDMSEHMAYLVNNGGDDR